MQTTRFSRCLIIIVIQTLCSYLKHYMLLMWTRSSSSFTKAPVNMYWLSVKLHCSFGLVIIVTYDKITAKSSRLIWMSVSRMGFHKWLPQIYASAHVCLVWKTLKVNILFNSCKSRLSDVNCHVPICSKIRSQKEMCEDRERQIVATIQTMASLDIWRLTWKTFTWKPISHNPSQRFVFSRVSLVQF